MHSRRALEYSATTLQPNNSVKL